MDPQSKKLEYKVGIFIAVGLIAGMAAILMLGGSKIFFTRYVHLHAKFTEVSGLFPGSVVSLAGLPVGNVSDIDFADAQNKLNVKMKINSEFKNRLVDGTIAEIRTQGALGDKYIYLSPGTPGGKGLDEDAELPSTESDLMKLLTDRTDGVARVIDLIKDLDVLVADINKGGQIGRTLSNITEITGKFKNTLGEVDGLMGDIRENIPKDKKLRTAIISLSNILEKIDRGQGTLGQLINDPSLHQSLKAFLGGSPRNKYMKDMIRETIQQSEK